MVVLAALSSFLTLALAAGASPLLERASVTDKQILSFALTLEHLENAFYQGGLAKYSEADFEKAGFKSFVRGRIQEIAEHEATHVAFLTKLIGPGAPEACTYKFPDTDASTFVSTAASLETGGVSAYLGAAALFKNPQYITDAGSILTTEARQASWLLGTGLSQAPWSGSFDVPLTANQVFSVVHGLIVDCPKTNPQLIARPFAPLTVSLKGLDATVKFTKPSPSKKYYLALYHGLGTSVVPITGESATIPAGLQGTVFAAVVDSPTDTGDDATVAGVQVLSFPFLSSANNSQ